MGNRAHVIFTDGQEISPAVYLHWNGGPESVYAFLDATEQRNGLRHDPSYAAARFAGTVADFFGNDGMSLGIVNGPAAIELDALDPFDHGDNGVYVYDVRTQQMRRFVSEYGSELYELARDKVEGEHDAALVAAGMPGYAAIRVYLTALDEAADNLRKETV